jgi:hypothetical protein
MKRQADDPLVEYKTTKIGKGDNKALCLYYFKLENPEKSDEKYICKCNTRRTQKPNTGWSNLLSHITTDHPEHVEEYSNHIKKNSLDNYFKPSQKALKIYGWLDFIISGGYALITFLLSFDNLACLWELVRNLFSVNISSYLLYAETPL